MRATRGFARALHALPTLQAHICGLQHLGGIERRPSMIRASNLVVPTPQLSCPSLQQRNRSWHPSLLQIFLHTGLLEHVHKLTMSGFTPLLSSALIASATCWFCYNAALGMLISVNYGPPFSLSA